MWSHYAGKSQGFCLEFDSSVPPFNAAEQVYYSARIPALNVSNILGLNSAAEVAKLYRTKSSDWAYEREWRIMHDTQNMEFQYEADSLTGIYFGPEMPPALREIACLVLQGQNDKVKFYQGRRSETDFKMVFEPFDYIPYLEAKRRGLK